MKASASHQSASQALLVLQQAQRDRAPVGIDRNGNLAYLSRSRLERAPVTQADPDSVKAILTAKIENELARFARSSEELRDHIASSLPSLSRLDIRAGAARLGSEWEQLLARVDRDAYQDLLAARERMERRQQLLDFLGDSLPAKLHPTTADGAEWSATIVPSPQQQQRMLAAFNENPHRHIDPTLNITTQLLKDSPRQTDLIIRLPGSAGAEAESVPLSRASPQTAASALARLAAARHAVAGGPASRHGSPDSADRQFTQVLSMLSDQTLMNKLDEFKAMTFGGETTKLLFMPARSEWRREISLDNSGNVVVNVTEMTRWQGMIAGGISPDLIQFQQQAQRDAPVDPENAHFIFRATIVVDRADAEQGRLNARFIGEPHMSISLCPDWQRIDPLLANAPLMRRA